MRIGAYNIGFSLQMNGFQLKVNVFKFQIEINVLIFKLLVRQFQSVAFIHFSAILCYRKPRAVLKPTPFIQILVQV